MSSAVDVAETIAVMRMKEGTTYICTSYLPEPRFSKSEHVDEECRVKMVDWCFQVVEFCNFSREVVVVGMSYLDRFLCTTYGTPFLEDRKLFQLAAMCCLYMSAKLFESRSLDLGLLSQLSRGVYSEKEIADMETTILCALNWFVHPPTAVSFINESLRSLPSLPLHSEDLAAIVDLSRRQTFLAVRDFSFVSLKQSSIAVAAIVNSLSTVSNITGPARSTILSHISEVTGINLRSPEITQARDMLRQCWEKSRVSPGGLMSQPGNNSGRHDAEKMCQGSDSPICVSRHSPRALA